MTQSRQPVVVVGTGPAGLMAAEVLSAAGWPVRLIEKKKGPGRKLLVAGSSGLNISYDAPVPELARYYGTSAERMERFLAEFGPPEWLAFVESLGIGTFKGSSRRYFVGSPGQAGSAARKAEPAAQAKPAPRKAAMKAAPLLRAWLARLESQGVELLAGRELTDFAPSAGGVTLSFSKGESIEARAAVLALGGGSWEPGEKPLRWPAIFRRHGVRFKEFEASNVGFEVAWPHRFLEEAEGQPLKNVVLRSSRGERMGDLMVTRYGIEGTPVYFAAETGEVFLDLKPDLSEERVLAKLLSTRENLSPIRRVKRFLNLSPAAFALVFHLTPQKILGDLPALAARLKRFPLMLKAKRPLDEAISSAGGVAWEELDESLMLRKCPGLFLAGEMIDWDAPTGGFLIQGCVSLGHASAEGALRSLGER
ncbi:MAG: TIGR03862 family flavoprotein [Oligoflexia bacterium]|nr:TIGR03862 family flavoprotein [Oligoflexia bacterium]